MEPEDRIFNEFLREQGLAGPNLLQQMLNDMVRSEDSESGRISTEQAHKEQFTQETKLKVADVQVVEASQRFSLQTREKSQKTKPTELAKPTQTTLTTQMACQPTQTPKTTHLALPIYRAKQGAANNQVKKGQYPHL